MGKGWPVVVKTVRGGEGGGEGGALTVLIILVRGSVSCCASCVCVWRVRAVCGSSRCKRCCGGRGAALSSREFVSGTLTPSHSPFLFLLTRSLATTFSLALSQPLLFSLFLFVSRSLPVSPPLSCPLPFSVFFPCLPLFVALSTLPVFLPLAAPHKPTATTKTLHRWYISKSE